METYHNTYPPEISNDDTLLFHGTSNISEFEFESGTKPYEMPFSLKDVMEISSVYNNLRWCGIHVGGYAVLSSFSQSGYFNGKRSLYFGETIKRCQLFSSRDFAGGELVRSIYYSIQDLIALIESSEIRENYQLEYEGDVANWDKPYELDLPSLSNKVMQLEPLFHRAKKIRESFKYGVIFGVKPDPDFYPFLQVNRAMGISLAAHNFSIRPLIKIIFEQDPAFQFDDELLSQRSTIWQSRTNSD